MHPVRHRATISLVDLVSEPVVMKWCRSTLATRKTLTCLGKNKVVPAFQRDRPVVAENEEQKEGVDGPRRARAAETMREEVYVADADGMPPFPLLAVSTGIPIRYRQPETIRHCSMSEGQKFPSKISMLEGRNDERLYQ